MRTTKQLLKLMRRKLAWYFWFLGNKGLCTLNFDLYCKDKISTSEYWEVQLYINSNLPPKKYGSNLSPYSWKPGRILPRYIWLTKQIKKLKY